MILQKITIENYRSIKKVAFDITKRDDNSFAYGFIGINEAGKSSILKAIGLKDGLVDNTGTKLPLANEFRIKQTEIITTYRYKITKKDDLDLYEILNKEKKIEPDQVTTADSQDAVTEQSDSSEKSEPSEAKKPKVKLPSEIFVEYVISFSGSDQDPAYQVTVFDGDQEIEVDNKVEFDESIDNNAHNTIFWTAEDRYLISKPINIEQFIADPNVSIPLRNCFRLASIKESEIAQKLTDSQSDSTECEHLENELGEKVTAHIKSAWPNHPIEITFKIMGGNIYFHVKDVGARGKAQTSDMRSDGFKQFVSFLLTVAAENRNEELHNTILLLDEPETHLHPKAQEYLLMQLVDITNNNKNNIVFFATHSNYMIDKKDLGRYYRVEKNKDEQSNEQTEIDQFDNKQTTYAEVSYVVFDVLDEQYHNELYDGLRDKFIRQKNSQEEDKTKHIDSIGIRPFDEQYFSQAMSLQKSFKDTSRPNDDNAKVTLPTYVRNCIHYPQNKRSNFDEKLKESIDILRSFLNGSEA